MENLMRRQARNCVERRRKISRVIYSSQFTRVNVWLALRNFDVEPHSLLEGSRAHNNRIPWLTLKPFDQGSKRLSISARWATLGPNPTKWLAIHNNHHGTFTDVTAKTGAGASGRKSRRLCLSFR